METERVTASTTIKAAPEAVFARHRAPINLSYLTLYPGRLPPNAGCAL
jgi:hypothetical protein